MQISDFEILYNKGDTYYNMNSVFCVHVSPVFSYRVTYFNCILFTEILYSYNLH